MTVMQRYGDAVAHRRGARVGRWVRQGTTIVVIDPWPERTPEHESGPERKRLGTPRTVPDFRFGRTARVDPQLVERARRHRLRHTDLSPESFRRNVAVIAYVRDGRPGYAVAANDPGALHSESVALRKIERGDRLWLRTKIIGVYSERQPCSDCARDLLGAKARTGIDFPVHYSVGQLEHPNKRATLLRERYAPRGGWTGVRAA